LQDASNALFRSSALPSTDMSNPTDVSVAASAAPSLVNHHDNSSVSEKKSVKLLSRVKAISSFQSLSRQSDSDGDEKQVIAQELAKVRALLSETRGFSSLDEGQLDHLLKSGKRCVFTDEQILIKQHDCHVGYFFVLISGSFKYVAESDAEASKSGFISSTQHGNVVGHFGSLYRRVRDSCVYSVSGSIAWRFSLEGVSGRRHRVALCPALTALCPALTALCPALTALCPALTASC
jgi:hypothetical protein